MSGEADAARAGARVYMVSLGCPKNLVDGESLLGRLIREGFQPSGGPEEAEVIVVNTCAFIQEAKEEALDTILEMAGWKERGVCKRLVVTGCLPQRYGEELLDLLPEVDLFLGTGEIPRIAKRLRALENGGARACHRAAPGYLGDEEEPRVPAANGATAYVKIAEGCSHGCAFCVIPAVRGPLRSRTVGSVVREVERLVASGAREVILVAQDTTAFGRDRTADGELPELLRALDGVDELQWIRLMYGHPAHISDDLLDVLATASRICPYLDLPVQHINGGILRAMNRRTRPREIRSAIRRLREAVPGLALRSSVIVGFPGETEESFRELLDFIEEVRFLWLGAFAFSREEGTAAYALGPGVPDSVVRRHMARLMEIQREITREQLSRWVGRTVPVLVEGKNGDSRGEFLARAPFQAPEVDGCVYLCGEGIRSGRIQNARITDVLEYDLLAEMDIGVVSG